MANERPQESERATDASQQRRGAGEQRSVARRGSESTPQTTQFASPFTLMRRFMEDVDRLFGGLGADARPSTATRAGEPIAWVPPVEAFERDGQFVVRAEIPGLSKDQIEVDVMDGHLVISGERSQEHEEKRSGFYRTERSYGAFYRAIPLPEGVNPEQATATFADGVLEITMPENPRPQGRRLEIQEGSQAKQAQKSASHAA